MEPVYKWEKLHNETYKTPFGSTVHILNVTSLEWLDTTKASGPNGALWTHLVYVVIPEKLTYKNISLAYITDGKNDKPNDVQKFTDANTWEVDLLAKYSESIVIAIEQIPNAPIVFPSDKSQKHRTEDAILAWAWQEYLNDPQKDPKWLPRLPMVKASYQCMRAAQEFLEFN